MTRIRFEGKKITVLGAKESGLQSALFLKRRGAEVFVSELRGGKEFVPARKTLETQGIASEFGQHTWEEIEPSELVIISPGIPPSAPIYQKLVRAAIPIWSEIELAYRVAEGDIIAVTGTNGKTTVTTLIRDVLRASGRLAVSCGNIGNSFISELENLKPGTIAVIEVSSFQLAHIDQFKPHIAVLLNLSPNHLNWHKNFDDYAETKCRIFRNQTHDDFSLVNASDPESRKRAMDLKSQVIYFDGREQGNPNYAVVEEVAKLYQIEPGVTRSVLDRFSGLEHRFEEAGELHGVHYINDSKSTTIASLGWALERVRENSILIAGGRHKGGDFRELRDLIRKRIRFLIVIGEAKKEIENAFGDLVSIYSADSLEGALRMARGVGRPGETVLFSPACASFDMFQDYQDRGRQFKNILDSWRAGLAVRPNR
ncbi:MAG: UDP-N-acetylmuramoyl-L-alanine--D-glutamate ligase [Candidatus Omnitrophica bacterium]|nr:UDP-N-acetylmuramoyl-L-alanine--D-glutamate ligase [Candidatus Omnitrophota bacterium]